MTQLKLRVVKRSEDYVTSCDQNRFNVLWNVKDNNEKVMQL